MGFFVNNYTLNGHSRERKLRDSLKKYRQLHRLSTQRIFLYINVLSISCNCGKTLILFNNDLESSFEMLTSILMNYFDCYHESNILVLYFRFVKVLYVVTM